MDTEETTFWREDPQGNLWRLFLEGDFDVSFDEDPGEDPRDEDEREAA